MPCGAKFDRNSIFHPYNGILDNSSMQSELSFFNQEIVAKWPWIRWLTCWCKWYYNEGVFLYWRKLAILLNLYMTFLGYFVKAVIYLFVYNVIFFNVFSNYKCYRTTFMGKFDLLQIFSEKKGKKIFFTPSIN